MNSTLNSIVLVISLRLLCLFINVSLVDGSTSCNFENGACGWSNGGWTWTTSEPNQGIRGINGTGHFMLFEGTGFSRALLSSPWFESSLAESACFSFWYYMNCSATSSLEVVFHRDYDKWPLMFRRNGNQGDEWLHRFVMIPGSRSGFQLYIEAVIRGDDSGPLNRIAIDDFEILHGSDCDPNNDHKVTSVSTTRVTTPLPKETSATTIGVTDGAL